MDVEFVDRYMDTGTPYPCPWTTCKGRCRGMGVYPTRKSEDGIEPKVPPETDEDMGYWFVTCERCEGSGRRVAGRKAYYLHLLYTYYYQVWFPFWAVYFDLENGFTGKGKLYAVSQLPFWVRFIHGEQRHQRTLLRAKDGRGDGPYNRKLEGRGER